MHTLLPEHKDMLLSKLQMTRDPAGNRLYLFGPVSLPIKLVSGVYMFQWYTWLNHIHDELPADAEQLLERLPELRLEQLQQSSLLAYGNFANAEEAKVRLHSICHTGDIFGSQRCDCGSQLRSAFEQIVEYGAGAIAYIANHEGRGIGLFNKALAYVLQEQGLDTLEANLALGHGFDERSYEDAVAVLKLLRAKPIVLLSNNPLKYRFLREREVKVSRCERALGEVSEHNRAYLLTKKARLRHAFEPFEPLESL